MLHQELFYKSPSIKSGKKLSCNYHHQPLKNDFPSNCNTLRLLTHGSCRLLNCVLLWGPNHILKLEFTSPGSTSQLRYTLLNILVQLPDMQHLFTWRHSQPLPQQSFFSLGGVKLKLCFQDHGMQPLVWLLRSSGSDTLLRMAVQCSESMFLWGIQAFERSKQWLAHGLCLPLHRQLLKQNLFSTDNVLTWVDLQHATAPDFSSFISIPVLTMGKLSKMDEGVRGSMFLPGDLLVTWFGNLALAALSDLSYPDHIIIIYLQDIYEFNSLSYISSCFLCSASLSLGEPLFADSLVIITLWKRFIQVNVFPYFWNQMKSHPSTCNQADRWGVILWIMAIKLVGRPGRLVAAFFQPQLFRFVCLLSLSLIQIYPTTFLSLFRTYELVEQCLFHPHHCPWLSAHLLYCPGCKTYCRSDNSPISHISGFIIAWSWHLTFLAPLLHTQSVAWMLFPDCNLLHDHCQKVPWRTWLHFPLWKFSVPKGIYLHVVGHFINRDRNSFLGLKVVKSKFFNAEVFSCASPR